MSQNHPDRSLNERQRHKATAPKLNYLCCELPAIPAKLPTGESLSTNDLVQVVGGVSKESGHLGDQAVLYPFNGEGADPFEPSPTYPSPPDIDVSTSH